MQGGSSLRVFRAYDQERIGSTIMSHLATSPKPPVIKNEIDIQQLWEKYEDIAMHFNDLLMRLRSQGLAGVAALSTLVGIFAKEQPSSFQIDWLVATFIFIALSVSWVAIGCIDLMYYNRLLMGAVAALVELEERSRDSRIDGINMSTSIVREFAAKPNYSRAKSDQVEAYPAFLK